MPEVVAGVGGGTVVPLSDSAEIASEAEFAKAAEELVFTLLMIDEVLDFVADNE